MIARFLPFFEKKLRIFKAYGDCEEIVRCSGILSMVGIFWVKIRSTQLNPLNFRKTLYNSWFSSHSPCPIEPMYFVKLTIKIITKH